MTSVRRVKIGRFVVISRPWAAAGWPGRISSGSLSAEASDSFVLFSPGRLASPPGSEAAGASDDGVETVRQYEIETVQADRVGHCRVPASEFGSMNWVAQHLGPRAIKSSNGNPSARKSSKM